MIRFTVNRDFTTRTHCSRDWFSFKSLRNRYHSLILSSKKQYYSQLVSSSSANPRRLRQTVNNLLHRKSYSLLPTFTSASSLADSFASFFTDKISKFRFSLLNNSALVSSHSHSPPALPPDYSTFKLVTESEISKILSSCPNKQSDSDPIPTWLLKECSFVLILCYR